MSDQSFIFHDWTLQNIEVDWPERVVKIKVLGWNKEGEITAHKFSNFTVPRLQEWGA